jgi:hypothetical protein
MMIDWLAARGWRRSLVAYVVLIPLVAVFVLVTDWLNFTERELFLAGMLLMTWLVPPLLLFRFIWRSSDMPFKERGLKGEEGIQDDELRSI